MTKPQTNTAQGGPPSSIPPGGVIGILGGGQLGRMTALAAARLGYRCHVFAPDAGAPASQVTDLSTVAAYDDEHALAAFARSVDVITYEFENIPLATANFLAAKVPLRPGPKLLEISQHRVREKEFAEQNGVPVARFSHVRTRADLGRAAADIGFPAILKTCRFGYDGKGQAVVRENSDLDPAWAALASDDVVLEQFIAYEKEISVIAARSLDGAVALYPAVENIHIDQILDTSIAPANISDTVAGEAQAIALRLAEASGLIGLLAVEMFVEPGGRVVMNEIAPRPHNSGHWSQDGAATCQFEQLVRAITGQVLGPPDIRHPTVMKNLIGEAVDGWPALMAEPGARLHLYGKAETRTGRKMGHVNRISRKA